MKAIRKRVTGLLVFVLAGAGLAAVPIGVQSASATCTVYYVSATSGSDSNSGCSSTAAWKTLTNVNATTFTSGNEILFQDGDSWTGELDPLGSGSSGSPIVISSYGSGAAPIIAGGGAAAAIYLDDQQYWTIENLEITNTTTSAAVRSGIQLENDTSGILNGIDIVNNNINNVLGYWVNGGPQPSTSSGIAFNLNDDYTTNGWNNVLIEDNTLTDDDAGGIYIGSLNGTGHETVTSNVVIQNNTLTNMGGNDIVCVYCESPLVQYNVATDSGSRYSGAGLWSALSTDGVWQYNEVSGQTRDGSDGEAFDIDHGDVGTILQYNYSHSNNYGFQEYCCGGSTGAATSIVRYNISQNDGSSNSVLAHQEYVGTGSTADFYNNDIYLSSSDNAPITDSGDSGVTYTNNIIDDGGTGGYGTGGTWDYNTFYGTHPASEPSDPNKLTSNPLFVSPGSGGSGRSSAGGYELQSTSPDIGAGELISGNGGLDFFGYPVSSTSAPNRGASNSSKDVVSPYSTFSSTTASFEDSSGVFTINAEGTDDWETNDNYGAIYVPGGAASSSTTTVEVTAQTNTNAWAKAGLMMRNNIAGSPTSLGYIILAVTPSRGITLQWDGSGDGQLNESTTVATSTTAPIWLRLVRSGSSVTGEYSTNDSTWTTVATETLEGANSTEDVGMFADSHDAGVSGTATFSSFSY